MRTHIQTLRFTSEELRNIQSFLRLNPSFASLSTLGRVAILDFIRAKTQLPIIPIHLEKEHERPPFIWDYDLSEAQVKEILQHSPMMEKKWLVARILEHAKLPDVLKYLTLEQIQQALPQLRLKPATKAHWEKAIRVWTKGPKKSLRRSK